jgi:hypothetical protein
MTKLCSPFLWRFACCMAAVFEFLLLQSVLLLTRYLLRRIWVMSFDPFDLGLVSLRFWKNFCFADSFEPKTVVEFWYEIAGQYATKICLHGSPVEITSCFWCYLIQVFLSLCYAWRHRLISDADASRHSI